MGTGIADGMNATEASGAKAERRPMHEFWNEKPAAKFCVGFIVFVTAEVIVYVTLHWIFPII